MHFRTNRSFLSSALCLLALAACGDDDKKGRGTDESPSGDGGIVSDGAVSGQDGAVAGDGSIGVDGGDASTRDAASDGAADLDATTGNEPERDGTVATPSDASSGTNDSGTQGGGDASSGSGTDGDAATGGNGSDAAAGGNGSDAAAGDNGNGSDAAAGGNGSDAAAGDNGNGSDAAAGDNGNGSDGGEGDAATTDAANGGGSDPTTSDAGGGGDAASGGDAGGCDVRDTRFGCGSERGSLVVFDSGYTVDRERRVVWAPVQTPLADNNESPGCGTEVFTGVDEWALPTIDQVKTLVQPCDAACELATDTCTGRQCNDECEACAANGGQHASGGYCRPELRDCSPMFTRDACDIGDFSDCDVHQHWYYDPATGVFKLVEAGESVAGRCIAQLTGELP